MQKTTQSALAGTLALAFILAATTGTGSAGTETAIVDDSIGGDIHLDQAVRHECGNGLLPTEAEDLLGSNVNLTWEDMGIGLECGTGDHTRGDTLTHGFGGFDWHEWDITATSTLSHAAGERWFRCEFYNGGFACSNGGDWPASGADFTHTCEAEGAIPDLMDLYLRGWRCQVTA